MQSGQKDETAGAPVDQALLNNKRRPSVMSLFKEKLVWRSGTTQSSAKRISSPERITTDIDELDEDLMRKMSQSKPPAGIVIGGKIKLKDPMKIQTPTAVPLPSGAVPTVAQSQLKAFFARETAPLNAPGTLSHRSSTSMASSPLPWNASEGGEIPPVPKWIPSESGNGALPAWAAPDSWAVKFPDAAGGANAGTMANINSGKMIGNQPASTAVSMHRYGGASSSQSSLVTNATVPGGAVAAPFSNTMNTIPSNNTVGMGSQHSLLSAPQGLNASETTSFLVGDTTSVSAPKRDRLWSVRVFKPVHKRDLVMQGSTRSDYASTSGASTIFSVPGAAASTVSNVLHASSGYTFATVLLPMNTTTAEMLAILGPKFFIEDTAKFNIYLISRGLERMLALDEQPVLLQKRWLEDIGFNAETDRLHQMGGEDHGYMFRFIMSEFPSTTLQSFKLPLADQLKNNSKVLNAVGYNLYMIPVVLFRYVHILESLDFSRNLMISLPLDFFQSCVRLKSLTLQQNEMDSLPLSVGHASTLQELDLSYNALQDFCLTPLSMLTQLTRLSLEANSLTLIPSELSSLTSLRYLNLASNWIRTLEAPLFELTQLEELNLSFNLITQIPSEVSQLICLTTLLLVSNQLTQLPVALAQLPRLRVLDVRTNQIQDLSSLDGAPKLQELLSDYNAVTLCSSLIRLPHLVDCSLTRNPLTQYQLQAGLYLRALSLAHCQLPSLPSDLFDNTPYLQRLILDGNHMTHLPRSLSHLSRLRHLSVTENKLTTWPEEWRDLGQLTFLDVHNNNLSEWPMALWRMKYLKTLNVSSNLIATISLPDEISELEIGNNVNEANPIPLDDQYIHQNIHLFNQQLILTSKPSSLESLTKPTSSSSRYALSDCLKELYIGENRLNDDCWDALIHLHRLEILNLSHNALTECAHTLSKSMPCLIELYLSGNQITSLPDEMDQCRQLKVLFVNGNKLSTLPADLSKNVLLTVLDASHNNLKYNISNWQFDYNWSWNVALRVLNLGGNRKLEIKAKTNAGSTRNLSNAVQNPLPDRPLAEFKTLVKLRLLDLTDIKLLPVTLPDENDECRVRTSARDADFPVGVAQSLSRHEETLYTWDLMNIRFLDREKEHLFGLFDGRGGGALAKYLYDSFGYTFATELRKPANAQESIVTLLRRTFVHLNKEYAIVHPDQVALGASVVVAYLCDNILYLANVGNAQAVLCRNGHAQCLSMKHVAWSGTEWQRIRQWGGWINTQGLVMNQCNVTRAFGHHLLMPCVNSTPFVQSVECTEQDEFLILACSGFWESISPQMAVDVARSEKKDLSLAAKKLRDFALSYGANRSLTVMVLSVRASSTLGQDRVPALRKPTQRVMDPVTDSTLARLEKEVAPPIGRVAMVFTDIRNSTQLWESLPQSMRASIKIHNSVMRRLLRTLGGYEVKTEGDAFMVAFNNIFSALKWCLTVQRQLLEADWPQEITSVEKTYYGENGECLYRGLSVRMGIHYGTPICEVDPITQRMDYFGSMVNRAARICAAAEGGQVFMSADVANAYRVLQQTESLSDLDPVFFEMGERKLKGLEMPEVIFACFTRNLVGRYYCPIGEVEEKLKNKELMNFDKELNNENEKSLNEKNENENSKWINNNNNTDNEINMNDEYFLIPALSAVISRLESILLQQKEDSFYQSFLERNPTNRAPLEALMDRMDQIIALLYITQCGQSTPLLKNMKQAMERSDAVALLEALTLWSEIFRKYK